jgi:two-component system response regulator FixJ
MNMTPLTPRETQVMALVCQGFDARIIGQTLCISSRTVEIHRASAIRRMGARNVVHAAVMFAANGKGEL